MRAKESSSSVIARIAEEFLVDDCVVVVERVAVMVVGVSTSVITGALDLGSSSEGWLEILFGSSSVAVGLEFEIGDVACWVGLGNTDIHPLRVSKG